MDKYRRQGMEYRFHDDAFPAPRLDAGPETRTDAAARSANEPGAVMQADLNPQDERSAGIR